MSQKNFTTCLELEIRSITCPGVWLCANGCISLIIEALGSQYETKILPASFPLIYHEVFRFRQRIENADSLESLKSALKEEYLYCELIQWSSKLIHKKGKILAKYKGQLSDLLYPPNIYFNNSVDLLMKASQNFPGIIAPKINVITKIQVSETINNGRQFVNDSTLLNRYRLNTLLQKNEKRQRTVCHSSNYHNWKEHIENAAEINKNHRYEALLLSNDNCQHRCFNHNGSNCSICAEYHRLFRDTQKINLSNNKLTYKIPEEHLLSKNCAKILGKDFVQNKWDYLYLDNEFLPGKNKFRKIRKEVKQSCCHKKDDCDDLHKKFDAIHIHCLCKE